jgi:hypothetical protein
MLNIRFGAFTRTSETFCMGHNVQWVIHIHNLEDILLISPKNLPYFTSRYLRKQLVLFHDKMAPLFTRTSETFCMGHNVQWVIHIHNLEVLKTSTLKTSLWLVNISVLHIIHLLYMKDKEIFRESSVLFHQICKTGFSCPSFYLVLMILVSFALYASLMLAK